MYHSAKFYQNQSFYPFLYKMFFSYTIYIITDIYKIIHKKPGNKFPSFLLLGILPKPI